MKQRQYTSRCRKGMAMLVVLFIVMAIAIISSGFIARSDAQLASGRNMCLRNEADYLTWAGLEHARALVVSPDNTDTLGACSYSGLQLDGGSDLYYDIAVDTPTEQVAADPNDSSTYTYEIQSLAYVQKGGAVRARSELNATLFYDPNNTEAYYISVRRQ